MFTENQKYPRNLKDNMFFGLKLDEQQKEMRDAIWSEDKLIIFSDSKAGSGKTLVAIATAQLLVQYERYDGIVFIATPTQESRIGYLPGTVEQKTEPYFEPLFQALIKLNLQPDKVINQLSIMNQKHGTGYIDILTHLYLRGQNFENKVVIIDEAQNLYTDELKKVLTRIHDNCKVIVIGHSGQVDLYHNPENSGFVSYLDWYRDEPYTSICNLQKNYRGKISSKADLLI